MLSGSVCLEMCCRGIDPHTGKRTKKNGNLLQAKKDGSFKTVPK
jgi:hypothetical protein